MHRSILASTTCLFRVNDKPHTSSLQGSSGLHQGWILGMSKTNNPVGHGGSLISALLLLEDMFSFAVLLNNGRTDPTARHRVCNQGMASTCFKDWSNSKNDWKMKLWHFGFCNGYFFDAYPNELELSILEHLSKMPHSSLRGNMDTFKRRRETEIKHGRVAMYATMGCMSACLPFQ